MMTAAFEGRLPGRSVTLSTQGLHLLLDALVEPIDLAGTAPERADDIAMLVGAGFLARDGSVPDGARDGVAAVRQPLCVIDVEAALGRVPRHYRAYIGARSAATYSTDPPFPGLGASSAAVAEYDVPPLRSRQFRIVARDWPPIDVAQWIGLTPRPERVEGQFVVPADVLTRRLGDAATPMPDDATDPTTGATLGLEVLSRVWAEPIVAWGMTVDLGKAKMMVLDAGAAGHFVLRRSGEHVAATGVSSRLVWRQMIAMVEAVLR